MNADKNLSLIEAELKAIRRAAEASSDYEAADMIDRAVASALQALEEIKLDRQTGTTEEIPAGVSEPDADPVPAAA